jgi:hypothetical protein
MSTLSRRPAFFHGAGVAPNAEDGEDGEAEGGEKGTDRSDAGMPQRV